MRLVVLEDQRLGAVAQRLVLGAVVWRESEVERMTTVYIVDSLIILALAKHEEEE